jgi:hypothetical protein
MWYRGGSCLLLLLLSTVLLLTIWWKKPTLSGKVSLKRFFLKRISQRFL